MSNKQYRITSETLNPLFNKSTVGYDQLVESLFLKETACSGYPPYNITRTIVEGGLDTFDIVLALAGFTEDDIEIVVENNSMVITGQSTILGDEDESVEYLHRGIAARKFTRSFKLAENVIVETAALKNGMLTVTLSRIVPDKKIPTSIKINTL